MILKKDNTEHSKRESYDFTEGGQSGAHLKSDFKEALKEGRAWVIWGSGEQTWKPVQRPWGRRVLYMCKAVGLKVWCPDRNTSIAIPRNMLEV